MYPNENFHKIAKIFIVAFLCSQMDSSFTQQNSAENRSAKYVNSINGSVASLENAKHLASIRLKALDKIFGEGHICAGTLIAPSVVLTAAQCIYDYNSNQSLHPSELKIVLGTVNRYEANAHTLSYGVTHIYQPKSFDPIKLRHNIAIVMLEQDIPDFHPTVRPIEFNKLLAHGQISESKVQQSYEFLSWGTTKEGMPLDKALLLNTSTAPASWCKQHLFYLFRPAGDSLCLALTKDETQHEQSLQACPEDAGAPLIYNNVLYGLSSFPSGCGIEKYPLLFTDVAYHSQWIMEQIGDGNNHNSSLWGGLGFTLFTMYTLRSLRVFKW